MKPYSKSEFMYECALRGFQGALSNPSQTISIASIVRNSEKLWHELQDWELQNQHPETDDEKPH